MPDPKGKETKKSGKKRKQEPPSHAVNEDTLSTAETARVELGLSARDLRMVDPERQ